LRRTFPKEGPTRIRNHSEVQSRTMWPLWSELQGAEPARGLPKEARIEFSHVVGTSSGRRCCVTELPPRRWVCAAVPEGPAEAVTRQLGRLFSRTGGPPRLGEPLPHQLTCWAQTSPSHPNASIESLR